LAYRENQQNNEKLEKPRKNENKRQIMACDARSVKSHYQAAPP